uniref:Alpha-mannosidase n=1 Tax=Glossina brevipalpis TaxID=37001 RepID=A0A1A9WEQ0_9MUSC
MIKLLQALLCCVLLIAIQECNGDGSQDCAYKACPISKENFINVHLVPHVHTDLGWIKKIRNYYYNNVVKIFDYVIEELLKSEERRFVQGEMAFFFLWFRNLSTTTQEIVRKLVKERRLEFVGGAWSANDEATVHYQNVIDQYTLGLKFISLDFDDCARPRIGWQLDAFGHSRTMAAIFAQMGYDGQFFSRVDFEQKETMLNNRSIEMIWQTSDDLDESSEIFFGVLYDSYHKLTEEFSESVDYLMDMSQHYRATDLLLPIGRDFHVVDFSKMDYVINSINARQSDGSKVNIFYSTPTCYLRALHRAQLTWPTNTQDFFPYYENIGLYWTGYFTSRPTFKYFVRLGNHFLQVVKQLAALSRLHGVRKAMQNLSQLKQVMGIMLHHDAITGTSTQQVTNDNSRILTGALTKGEAVAKEALRKLTSFKDGDFVICLLLNISICEITQIVNKNFSVTVYNPSTRLVGQYVRIPVRYNSYHVENSKGNIVESQLVPLPRELVDMELLKTNLEIYELVFKAEPDKMGHYHIRSNSNHNNSFQVNASIITGDPNTLNSSVLTSQTLNFESKLRELKPEALEHIVENSLIKLHFSHNGFLKTVQMNNISQDIEQKFQYYESSDSGAYIFATANSEAQNVGLEEVKLTVYEGPLVKEIHQCFNNWTSQVIRLYEGVNRIEFEWLLGPIPIRDGIGKEVITKFKSTIFNQGIFYTDSNGREMIKRSRKGSQQLQNNTISRNYHPITGRLVLEGNGTRMAILNDRAQGGSNTEEGALELMLHRRLLNDDGLGVDEVLNETEPGGGAVARGKIYLILSSANKEAATEERLNQQEIHLPIWLFFSQYFPNISSAVSANFSSLPKGIQVLSLEPFMAYETLLRLEYLMDSLESSSVTFDLNPFLVSLEVEEIRETTLDGNMLLKDMQRLKFQKDGSHVDQLEYYTAKHKPLEEKLESEDQKFEITMEPKQIRTFIIKHKEEIL